MTKCWWAQILQPKVIFTQDPAIPSFAILKIFGPEGFAALGIRKLNTAIIRATVYVPTWLS